MNLLLILNPQAGYGNGERLLPQIRSAFAGHALAVRVSRRPADTIAAAREAVGKVDAIIAAGGDGTINQVMSAIVGTNIPLGVIPLGTANVFAQEFHIPFAIPEACAVIKEMHVRAFDVGTANHHYFLMWAGIGLDAGVLSEMTQLMKQIFGISAYPLAALKKLLTYRSHPMRVEIDGTAYTSYFTIISNIRNYGGVIRLSPDADPHDGLLDVSIFPDKLQLFTVIRSFIELKAGVRSVPTIKATHVRITAPTGILVHTDAEVLGTTPLTVTVIPHALSVIVPRRHGAARQSPARPARGPWQRVKAALA
ncbi:MAG TPA: diacylglycerol kinase family protein [Candidatus Nanoarchaeia archaeon]|nr:diacylglycerol kinase family protein [Candidatus Nanoarchaeia archaeon]